MSKARDNLKKLKSKIHEEEKRDLDEWEVGELERHDRAHEALAAAENAGDNMSDLEKDIASVMSQDLDEEVNSIA